MSADYKRKNRVRYLRVIRPQKIGKSIFSNRLSFVTSCTDHSYTPQSQLSALSKQVDLASLFCAHNNLVLSLTMLMPPQYIGSLQHSVLNPQPVFFAHCSSRHFAALCNPSKYQHAPAAYTQKVEIVKMKFPLAKKKEGIPFIYAII